jgi:hypothetical protein
MAREPNKNKSDRLYIRPSAAIVAYLKELANLGVHGTTPSEVAKTLVGYEIERLMREDILDKRGPRAKRGNVR